MKPEPDPPPAPPARVFAGGFLMGLANLVPGVSGGTMILALGLYDEFIGAVARLTSLRWSRALFLFCSTIGVGLAVAVLGLAGPAVWLVQHLRWVMYSLFIGMTLGGVPALLRLARPLGARELAALVLALAGMAWLTFGLASADIAATPLSLVLVGALAASSMILPGVSGSYILLVFGFYDVVIGSLSASALLDEPAESLGVILPTGVGVLLGIGLLSNVLKWLLGRWRGPSHAALLGLLLGAVLGLYPCQDSVHPELAGRSSRKAVEALLAGATPVDIAAEHGVDFSAEEQDALRSRYGELPLEGRRGELKKLGLMLERYTPGAGQVAGALGLVLLGVGLTTLLGGRGGRGTAGPV